MNYFRVWIIASALILFPYLASAGFIEGFFANHPKGCVQVGPEKVEVSLTKTSSPTLFEVNQAQQDDALLAILEYSKQHHQSFRFLLNWHGEEIEYVLFFQKVDQETPVHLRGASPYLLFQDVTGISIDRLLDEYSPNKERIQ